MLPYVCTVRYFIYIYAHCCSFTVGVINGQYTLQCFQCRDRCITYSWRCDGEPDCYYGEDEADCDFICPYSTHHRCADTGYCIDNFRLCDGHYDCQNGEDERNCYSNSWVGNKRHHPSDHDFDHDVDHDFDHDFDHDKLTGNVIARDANHGSGRENAGETKDEFGARSKSFIDRKEDITFSGYRNRINETMSQLEALVYRRR